MLYKIFFEMQLYSLREQRRIGTRNCVEDGVIISFCTVVR